MFEFHIALALSLISLSLGYLLLGWTTRKLEGACRAWGVFFGYVVVILSILSLLCALWTGYRLWHAGYMDPEKMMAMDQAAMSNSKK
jgi:peptidoglycan biosynthesis protein MviN/MurJ (putative lipid II flippase)